MPKIDGIDIFRPAATSASSGAGASTASTSYSDIPNLSVSYKASGFKRVRIEIIPDGVGLSAIDIVRNVPNGLGNIKFFRDAVAIGELTWEVFITGGGSQRIETGAYAMTIDTPVAGTYTYKAQYRVGTGADVEQFSVSNCKLVVSEIP